MRQASGQHAGLAGPRARQDQNRPVDSLDGSPLRLKMISSRGTKVYPPMGAITDAVDHWRCRFMIGNSRDNTDHADIVALLAQIAAAGFDFIKVENLYTFDGEAGYSLGQGQ